MLLKLCDLPCNFQSKGTNLDKVGFIYKYNYEISRFKQNFSIWEGNFGDVIFRYWFLSFALIWLTVINGERPGLLDVLLNN